jgi:hypothetical protein
MGYLHRYGWMQVAEFMDEEQFMDEGYLLEANRQFFHPLGLQLALQVTDDGLRLRVHDRRAFIAGPIYEPDEDRDPREKDRCSRKRRAKVARIRSLWESRAQFRLKRYGYVVQPVEEL